MIRNARAKSSRTLGGPSFEAQRGSCLEPPTSSATSCPEDFGSDDSATLGDCKTSARAGNETARDFVRAFVYRRSWIGAKRFRCVGSMAMCRWPRDDRLAVSQDYRGNGCIGHITNRARSPKGRRAAVNLEARAAKPILIPIAEAARPIAAQQIKDDCLD